MDMKVKRLTKEQGKRFDICRFSNLIKRGIVECFKSTYYGRNALLLCCGLLLVACD